MLIGCVWRVRELAEIRYGFFAAALESIDDERL